MVSPPRWSLPLLLALGLGCGPTVRRDLATMPQRQITFDDLCHLQDHFDQRIANRTRPFASVAEQSVETTALEPDENGRLRARIVGEGTYIIATPADRRRFVRLLRDEYQRLPPLHVGGADAQIRVRLGWWGSGAIRRTRPDTDIVVTAGTTEVELPPSPCVGEFLFGQHVYAMRHRFLDDERIRAQGGIPHHDDDDAGSDAGDAGDAATDAPAFDATMDASIPLEAAVDASEGGG